MVTSIGFLGLEGAGAGAGAGAKGGRCGADIVAESTFNVQSTVLPVRDDSEQSESSWATWKAHTIDPEVLMVVTRSSFERN